MADDKMNDDDLKRNMGSTGEGKDYDKGQQTPGRNPSTGGQQGQPGGQQGGQKEPRNMEDDDLGAGGNTGAGQERGGQNR